MIHIDYLQKCLELANNGLGLVAPNPMVGCVVVHNDTIIGQGYHEQFGGPHAEVNAINSVKDHDLLSLSTLYVNLEPCSHFGKTPPCADLIIERGIKKVVIGSFDPNPQVAGSGVSKLQAAGTEVITDVLADECSELNKRFFTFHQKKRPYVILKWAETKDGFIARSDFDSKWISCEESRKLVHQWRAEEMAILVGTNTAMYDNPKLSVRHVSGNDPLRVIIDRKLKVPTTHHLYDLSQPTLIVTELEKANENNLHYLKVDFTESIPSQILKQLYQRNITSLIIEGGAKTSQQFIDQDLWDETRIFKAPHSFHKGILAPILPEKAQLKVANEIPVGVDQLVFISNFS